MTCPLCGDAHTLSQCPRWKAPTCDNCARAMAAGAWCGYTSSCNGCTARAIARGPFAAEAVRTRDRTELRKALAAALPEMPFDQAAELARAWWVIDHPKKEVSP